MRISVEGVTVVLEGVTILTAADLVVETGTFVGLVGPNGSGKSTLLRTIYRALRPELGVVRVGGDDVWRLGPKEAARRTAVVPQQTSVDLDFTVLEIVAMGRTPHKGTLDRDTAEDDAICRSALVRVGMADVADRIYASLSGGERQRVVIARALAQQAPVLVLDEPTNHLDVRFQLELLDLVRSLGITIIAAMHDLGLAARYCDQLCVVEAGRLIGIGSPAEILTPQLIARVFGVQVQRWANPTTGRSYLAFEPLPADGTDGPNRKESITCD